MTEIEQKTTHLTVLDKLGTAVLPVVIGSPLYLRKISYMTSEQISKLAKKMVNKKW